MRTYTLAIAWNWEFDQDFIVGIEKECTIRGLSTYRIDSQNLHQVLSDLKAGAIAFQAFFDRATDADVGFLPLVHLLEKAAVYYYINPFHRVVLAVDKATMHLELITHGIYVPYTIILPPYNRTDGFEVDPSGFERVGHPFVIKPANTTGGGTGVVLNARTLNDVARSRQDHKDDKYLVQEMIYPKHLDGKRAWFRCYCVFNEIIPCWWDDTTHMYTELRPEEETRFGLEGLRTTMQTIQQICKLDFFSSEIALTDDGRFIVVDYVNEVCDMRLKSKYANGAPDSIVNRIERLIAEHVAQHTRRLGNAGMTA
ncbi:MAG: hypothetical protein HYR76_12330 [Ignavibacteria bacterium]|nr:hypothetical protein [Ignavibacteria bacterium]MBI3764936.1 hypothetical protein [Ignavibacteriales bacterium]